MSEVEQGQAALAELTTLTAEIVGAYVQHHSVASADLPVLIASVGKELAGLGQEPIEPADEKPKPVVPIKRSVRPDAITCLICGKPQKLLKRHLATRHELDPDGYRAMFGLKDDYPVVAPDYAARRSVIAKKIGLGQKPVPKKPAKAARKKTPRKVAAKKR